MDQCPGHVDLSRPRTRWAILGPGAIAGDFALALTHSRHGALQAVGSSSPNRAAAFADAHGAPASGIYREILERDDIDAVYISTVHTTHEELAVAALAAGKAVLCEKPISPGHESTRRVLDAAARAQRPFMEAYKYRFGPLAQELRTIIARGEVGYLQTLEASFGFAATQRSGRLFTSELAGGAILDAGSYPASLAVGIARWAGIDGGQAVVTSAEGHVGETGVDEWAAATVQFGGLTATLRTAIVNRLSPRLVVTGTRGTIQVPNVWGSRIESATTAVVHRTGAESRSVLVHPIHPLAAEADAVSDAIEEGRSEIPEMTWAESSDVATVLQDWRLQLH